MGPNSERSSAFNEVGTIALQFLDDAESSVSLPVGAQNASYVFDDFTFPIPTDSRLEVSLVAILLDDTGGPVASAQVGVEIVYEERELSLSDKPS